VSALFGGLPLEEIDWSTVWSKKESLEKGEKKEERSRRKGGKKFKESERRARLIQPQATLAYNPEAPSDSFQNRCCYIVETLRAQKLHYQPLYVVHDSSVRASTLFSGYLVEDKSFSMTSYFEFVQSLQYKINSKP
jgi:hypothetical protein